MVRHLARFGHYCSFEMHRLVVQKDGSSYIVGREQTEIFVRVPKVGHDILKLMKRGLRVEEMDRRIHRIHGEYDVHSFIYSMIDHGFVKKINNKELVDSTHPIITTLFPKLKSKHVSWLFSPPLYAIYFGLFAFAAVLLAITPSLFPTFEDFFFTQSTFLLLIISFVVGLVLVFWHEMWHFLAARSLNIKARFGLTTRAMYLVFITDVTNLYTLPRKQRYRVILAGPLSDLCILCLSMILIWSAQSNLIPRSWIPFLGFIAISELMGLFWQFLFFLRTDLYYALENLFRVENLHEKANHLLKGHLHGAFKRYHPGPLYDHEREHKFTLIYALLYLLGYLVLFAMLIFYSIPILVGLFKGAVADVSSAILYHDLSNLFEAIVFLLFFSVNQTLFFQAMIRERKLHHNKYFLWFTLILFIMGNYFVSYFLLIFSMVIMPTPIIYPIALGLGFLFGALFCWIIKELNRLEHHTVVYEWLFVPVAAIIFALVLFKLLGVFSQTSTQMVALSITGIVMLYALGLLASVVWFDRRLLVPSTKA